MPIDFSNLLLAGVLYIAALIAGAIMLAYLAIVIPVTFTAWVADAIDSKKIVALFASSLVILAELLFLILYLTGKF